MISDEIKNIKDFMSELLISNSFDSYLVTDVTITTFNTFHIDGHIKKEFYSASEYEDMNKPLLSQWSQVKKYCYDIIKGKKTPLSFKIIFMMPDDIVRQLIYDNSLSIDINNITGLFINIKYENGHLSYTTGTSLNILELDKSTEKAFDKYIVSTLFEWVLIFSWHLFMTDIKLTLFEEYLQNSI